MPSDDAGSSGRAISQVDPEDAEPGDYLRAITGGETAIHVYLKDDKEWWLAHNEGGEYPGDLNGPWLFWHTYPSGPWVLDFCTREILSHHVEELYYVDYNGEEAHSVHEVDVVALSDAPEFVRGEFDGA